MPTSKSGADEFIAAAFSQKMFVKKSCCLKLELPLLFYDWYRHPNAAEVSD